MPPRRTSKQSNEEHQLPVGCWLVPFLFFLFLLVSSTWQARESFYTDTHVSQCDGIFFDNIRMNLALGDGFELDFTDSTAVQNAAAVPANVNSAPSLNWLYSLDVDGETANHFPAVPYLMLVGQTVLSDQNYFIGFLGTLLLAVALAILINQIRTMFGVLPAALATLTLLADSLLQQSPTLITGDAVMTGLLTLSVVIFLQATNPVVGSSPVQSAQLPRSIWKWPISGLLLGTTMLFRPATSLWLIIIVMAVVVTIAVKLIRKNFSPRGHEAILLFSIGLLIAIAPWWIRNCKVTGEFKPLGNEIQQKIIGSHVFGANIDGNLNIEEVIRHRENFLANLVEVPDSPIEKESLVAKNHWEKTQAWAESNSALNLNLKIKRILNHHGLINQKSPTLQIANGVLFVGALLGCVFTWRRLGFIVVTLVLASTIVTALTWSDYGLLSIPIRPLLHIAFAAGLASFISRGRGHLKSNPTQRSRKKSNV